MKKRLLIIPVLLILAITAVWLSVGRNRDDGDKLVLHGNIDIRQVELAFNGSGVVNRCEK